MLEYQPILPRDQARIHQFGKKVLPGIFLGYELVAGGIWKEDILIADIGSWKTWKREKSIIEESMQKNH